ncbi:hypothetical protein LCGC14_2472910, partial [marine sediment metagenome]
NIMLKCLVVVLFMIYAVVCTILKLEQLDNLKE